jgi:predicted TIM-barrel fold metal-dependent hydrolase
MINGKYYAIDAHCHIYPEKIAKLAVDHTDNFYSENSFNKGTIEDLISASDKVGIDKCVIQSVATTPKQVQSINKFISDSVNSYQDRFVGLGTIHPRSLDIEGDIEHLIELGLKGIKIHPDIQDFKVDDDGYKQAYKICEKKGLPVLMHTGDNRYDNSNPNRLIPILNEFKNLTVVGAHFGGWSIWEEASEKLCELPNLYVDTCSAFFALEKETALKIIRRYGADKVIFATDYPMWRQKDELDYILSLGLTDDELEKIFCKNILKVIEN